MPTLIRTFNWGSPEEEDQELYRKLNEAYTDTATVMNTKVSKRVISGTSPPANSGINKNFEIGDVWVRTDTNVAYMMTSRTTSEAVTWTLIT